MRELAASSFELASCQATVFTPDGDLSVSRAMRDFYPVVVSLFDGEPTILPPIPEGAPAEIPRIILESGSHEWRCELSPLRVNLLWRRTESTSQLIELPVFFGKAVEIIRQYADRLSARIGRLAAVATRFAAHESPGLFLARHFCQERWEKAPLNRPENFELHAHKRFLLADEFEVNSWARSKTGRLAAGPPQQAIVVFEQDVNTLKEEADKRVFAHDAISRFFVAVGTELETILRLYYPEA